MAVSLDIPTLIELVRKRVKNDNGLTNIDSEYQDDIKEAISLYVNPDQNTLLDIDDTTFVFNGETEIDSMLFSLIALRTELIIIDRKLEEDIELAVTSNTPAGTINLTNRPKLRTSLRRDMVMNTYTKLGDIYKYGYITGNTYAMSIDDLLANREVPFE